MKFPFNAISLLQFAKYFQQIHNPGATKLEDLPLNMLFYDFADTFSEIENKSLGITDFTLDSEISDDHNDYGALALFNYKPIDIAFSEGDELIDFSIIHSVQPDYSDLVFYFNSKDPMFTLDMRIENLQNHLQIRPLPIEGPTSDTHTHDFDDNSVLEQDSHCIRSRSDSIEDATSLISARFTSTSIKTPIAYPLERRPSIDFIATNSVKHTASKQSHYVQKFHFHEPPRSITKIIETAQILYETAFKALGTDKKFPKISSDEEIIHTRTLNSVDDCNFSQTEDGLKVFPNLTPNSSLEIIFNTFSNKTFSMTIQFSDAAKGYITKLKSPELDIDHAITFDDQVNPREYHNKHKSWPGIALIELIGPESKDAMSLLTRLPTKRPAGNYIYPSIVDSFERLNTEIEGYNNAQNKSYDEIQQLKKDILDLEKEISKENDSLKSMTSKEDKIKLNAVMKPKRRRLAKLKKEFNKAASTTSSNGTLTVNKPTLKRKVMLKDYIQECRADALTLLIAEGGRFKPVRQNIITIRTDSIFYTSIGSEYYGIELTDLYKRWDNANKPSISEAGRAQVGIEAETIVNWIITHGTVEDSSIKKLDIDHQDYAERLILLG